MSEAGEVKNLYIKAVINKEKTKVLFVEAGSDFTDTILSFLLLPLGTIVKVLKMHYGDETPVIGSLNTLYDGAADLDIVHFCSKFAKKRCIVSIKEDCGVWGYLKFNYTDPSSFSYPDKQYDGVFTRCADSFIISDDLQIMPAGSVINTLYKFGLAITDMDGAETRTVAFGIDEIMDLLKASLISQHPLITSLLLSGCRKNLATVSYEHGNTQIDEKVITLNSKKMALTVTIQKSTFKVLFAQAETDFINFLFSLIFLPLGRVEWYLGSNTGCKNIDNLHRSISADNNHYNYLRSGLTKDSPIKPTPPWGRICSDSNEFNVLNFEPNNEHYYPINGSRMYMVTDDLCVTPMTITSTLSVINELKISFSDVRDLELQVGLEEGLNIMKAALTSTTALTNGLITPLLKARNLI